MADHPELTQKLLTLGELQDVVPDYKALGFSNANADGLIRVATDPDLLNNDDQSPLFWATVHAWYALGQLQVVDAIKPLLNLHDEYPFDMYLHSEIAKAISFMGVEAIPHLNIILWDSSQSETTKSEAISCLEKLGKKHRIESLSALNDFLAKTTHEHRTLAGFAICALIKLQATESIEIISDTFKRQCVDISIPGDLEDVEIALGLRTKRVTPKPNYNTLSSETMKNIEDIRKHFRLDEDDMESSSLKHSAKIGRNDPCHCGSGKKYKKCCLH
jgi:hypothetical protein